MPIEISNKTDILTESRSLCFDLFMTRYILISNMDLNEPLKYGLSKKLDRNQCNYEGELLHT